MVCDIERENVKMKNSHESLVRFMFCLFLPTIALTRKSQNKTVRALGQIGAVFPLLPLTFLGSLVTLVCVFCILVGHYLHLWWKSV